MYVILHFISVFVNHFPIPETKIQNLSEQDADLKFCYETLFIVLQQSILELII
jgi:hypothetical protein